MSRRVRRGRRRRLDAGAGAHALPRRPIATRTVRRRPLGDSAHPRRTSVRGGPRRPALHDAVPDAVRFDSGGPNLHRTERHLLPPRLGRRRRSDGDPSGPSTVGRRRSERLGDARRRGRLPPSRGRPESRRSRVLRRPGARQRRRRAVGIGPARRLRLRERRGRRREQAAGRRRPDSRHVP